jgi:hypothetical protein
VVGNVPGGKVIGLAAGSFAAAGKVGEVISASATVPLSPSVTANITSITLSAGNWLMFAEYNIGNGATMQNINVLISTATAVLTGLVGNVYSAINMAAGTTFASGSQYYSMVGMTVVSIASPTTYYLNANCFFTGGMNIGGVLTAVRLA